MLAVRFSVPAAPRILVHRPALLRRLTAGIERPLTLVSGAAGAGKTVLAAHWAASGEAPRATVWLTAERPDAPGVFWAYLLEAFRRHGVELPVAVGSPARTEGVDRSFLVRLAAALADLPEPVVLILDEFDTVSSREITDNLHFVLAHADGGLRLVLTGRVEPLLPLHRYRAAGDIAEIRNADLRFTVAEADELLRGHTLDVSPAGVRLLVRRTEGWAAGLRLCALAMQRGGDPEAFVREFAADRTTIADYLLTEVLDAQPPTTQDLLLRAGITDRVHPDLMDALTGRRDAEWTLARLARANAFLDRVDESDWYRLHPLFAEVLRAHLRHRCPGLEPRLHARAARWLAGTGRPTDAIVQATAAADWRFAAELMVDNLAIGRLFTGLESERLAHAFSGLPPDTPGAAAALVGAACRAADHDLDGCAAGLRRADAHPTGRAGPAARLGRALVGVLAGRLAGDPAATEHAAADVDRLLRRLPPPLREQHPEIPALVRAGLGAAELGAGRLDRAEAELGAAVKACHGPGTEDPLCDALGSLALVELLRGRLREAEAHAYGSLTVAEASAMPPDRPVGVDHLVLAGVAAERDDLAAARTQLDLAIASAGPYAEPVATVEAAVIGSRLAIAAGDWEQALAVLRAAGSAFPSAVPMADWEADELAIAESRAHLAHGDADAALAALDDTECGRPEHAVALARVLLAAGRRDRALEVLADLADDVDATATSRAQACLLRAEAAAEAGSPREAHRLLCAALGLARTERLRRVFVEAGPWTRRLLRQDPEPARVHGRLPARALGHPRAGARTRSPAAVTPLSDRENEVLRQVAQMLSTREIAAELYLSTNTVKTHLKSIYRKLCVTRRSEAVRRARELGIL
ncbi:LuxR C-terminal-related transcriptional regulator [Embleya sp. NBC_00896]|uniref:LuxR C-terminal-related transcriptional regulator n=1 Tax=Embleya sp. NBC_00896 TaxID=2975961 RepID=UPI002F90F112|nr:LuxR C-terminal-related transcriptional regulator [Embleya sp. NBC_00896]